MPANIPCRASRWHAGTLARWHAGTLARSSLVMFENSAMTVSLLPRHLAQVNTEELFICRQVAGQIAMEQCSRDAAMKAGDFALLDPRLPYQARFSEGSRMLVVKVPRRQLQARLGPARDLVARVIRPDGGEAGLTSGFLALLPAHTATLSPAAQEIVEDQVLDLVAVSMKIAMDGQSVRVSSARSLVQMKLHAAIEARLANRGLNASAVAAAAGVSVRYANAVLADEGTSIVRLIQSRRLRCCRLALEDHTQSHRTLSEIAYSWGVSDMTHFGRAFRSTYGMLPSECRKCAKTSRSP
jgi:AraC-like DNA-binding protein